MRLSPLTTTTTNQEQEAAAAAEGGSSKWHRTLERASVQLGRTKVFLRKVRWHWNERFFVLSSTYVGRRWWFL